MLGPGGLHAGNCPPESTAVSWVLSGLPWLAADRGSSRSSPKPCGRMTTLNRNLHHGAFPHIARPEPLHQTWLRMVSLTTETGRGSQLWPQPTIVSDSEV